MAEGQGFRGFDPTKRRIAKPKGNAGELTERQRVEIDVAAKVAAAIAGSGSFTGATFQGSADYVGEWSHDVARTIVDRVTKGGAA